MFFSRSLILVYPFFLKVNLFLAETAKFHRRINNIAIDIEIEIRRPCTEGQILG